LQIEFPSILLPPNISSGSIVDITVGQNVAKEEAADAKFRALQDRIYQSFGASEPSTPALRCCNATQTSVVLEWDPIELATADIISLSLYRNGQKAGNIPRPLQMQSTKISGLAVDTEYTFHLVLRTTAGTYPSEKVVVRTHKMTDLSGITITTGILPAQTREQLTRAVERIGAKIVDTVRIDTSHFVTTEGRGQGWEKAVEINIPVVRPEWVEACEKNGRILGVAKFYLDAMRPGPSSEDAPLPAPPPPEKPDAPAANGMGSKAEEPSDDDDEEEAAEKDKDKAKVESSDDDDEEEDEDAEQKIKSPAQEEQKVRLQDKEQKVALRPGGSGGGGGAGSSNAPRESEDTEATGQESKEGDDDGDDEEDGEEGEGEEGGSAEKPSRTPDGASFQDVEL
jgi:hypothetical protein